MRVVFDTNVLVSALVFPDGRADAAVRKRVSLNKYIAEILKKSA